MQKTNLTGRSDIRRVNCGRGCEEVYDGNMLSPVSAGNSGYYCVAGDSLGFGIGGGAGTCSRM